MRRFGSALVPVVLTIGAASGMGCRKSGLDLPMRWDGGDAETVFASAKAQNKRIFLYFGADWDAAAKKLEHETFVDPEVGTLLRRQFISIKIDTTDDDDGWRMRALQQRFNIVGDPTIIILGPDGSEMVRFQEYVPPRILARALKSATRASALTSQASCSPARFRLCRPTPP